MEKIYSNAKTLILGIIGEGECYGEYELITETIC